MSDRLAKMSAQFSASSVTKGSCMCGNIEYEFKGMSAFYLHSNAYHSLTHDRRAERHSALPLRRLPQVDRRRLHLQRAGQPMEL